MILDPLSFALSPISSDFPSDASECYPPDFPHLTTDRIQWSPKPLRKAHPAPGWDLGPRETKRILGSLLLAVFTVMLGVGIIAPLLPGYAQSLGANGIVLGLIFSIFSLFRTFFTPVTGILSDRWGRKHFMTTGMLAYFILSLAYVQAQSTPVLLIVRALHGLAAAFIVPVANAYVGDLAPPRKKARTWAFSLPAFLQASPSVRPSAASCTTSLVWPPASLHSVSSRSWPWRSS